MHLIVAILASLSLVYASEEVPTKAPQPRYDVVDNTEAPIPTHCVRLVFNTSQPHGTKTTTGMVDIDRAFFEKLFSSSLGEQKNDKEIIVCTPQPIDDAPQTFIKLVELLEKLGTNQPQFQLSANIIGLAELLNINKQYRSAFEDVMTPWLLNPAQAHLVHIISPDIYARVATKDPYAAYRFKASLVDSASNCFIKGLEKAEVSLTRATHLMKLFGEVLHGRVVAKAINVKRSLNHIENLIAKNPHATLVVDFEDNTTIPDHFHVGKKVKKVVVRGDQVQKIGDNFLENCYGIESLDMTSLKKVTDVGNSFLDNCSGLTSVDLEFLRNVRKIKNGFLLNCGGIEFLNLEPLRNVREIGESFLGCCGSLPSINLEPLSGVRFIGPRFLLCCDRIKSLDVTSLDQVIYVGNYFLGGCSDLESLTLPALRKNLFLAALSKDRVVRDIP